MAWKAGRGGSLAGEDVENEQVDLFYYRIENCMF